MDFLYGVNEQCTPRLSLRRSFKVFAVSIGLGILSDEPCGK